MSIQILVASLCRLVDHEGSGAGSSQSRGALAELRRALLSSEGAVSAYRHVAAHIPKDEEPADYLLIGSLFGMNPRHVDERSRDLGVVCAELGRQKDGSISAASERRFVAMLSSRRRDIAPHLRRVVTMADRAGVSINYVRLFYDLRNWEQAGTRSVQLAWARSFYATYPETARIETADTEASGQNG